MGGVRVNVIYSVKLNVSEKNVFKSLILKQNDSNSRFIDCAFMHGRFMLLIRTGTVVLNVTRADGQHRSFAGTINDNGTVRIPVANWMVENAGMIDCDVSVFDGDEKLTSALFSAEVQASANPDGSVSPDDPAVDMAMVLIARAEDAAADAHAAVEEIESKFKGAGINSESLETILDTTTVTTEQHSGQTNPWAVLSSIEDMLKYTRLYNCKVTFDGVEYIVKGQDWFSESGNTNSKKCGATLGNINFVNDPSGFCGIVYDVPFLITGMMDINGRVVEGLYLYTQTASTHTVKIEKIVYDYVAIPKTLLYGSEQTPIYVDVSGQTYNGYSIGSNRLIKSRQVAAIGYGNVMRKETTFALGNSNVLNGGSAVAIGVGHTCSGISASVLGGQQGVASANFAVSIGSYNTASGQAAVAMGNITTASGAVATATGSQTVASGSASATFGIQTKANHRAQFVFGAFNEEDASSAESYSRGNYVEVVGNGTADDARSNARTLDWEGNEALSGSLTLRKGKADELTISPSDFEFLSNGYEEIDISNLDTVPFTISSQNKTTVSGQSASIQIPLTNKFGKYLYIMANAENGTFVTFLKEAIPADVANGTDITSYLASGQTGRKNINAGDFNEFTYPSDAMYALVHVSNIAGYNLAPAEVTYLTYVMGQVITLLKLIKYYHPTNE